MTENTSSLKFKNVTFAYSNDKTVLSNISFEAINHDTTQLGHVTAIMGESGAGKSTILKLLLGIETNYTGEIITNPKQPIISYVPQEALLFEHLTPLQNARYFENISNYKTNFNLTLFNSLVETLDLNEVLRAKSVNEISGGQRQRLSLLRALSIKPHFLLLDEPCTGLDADVKIQFLYKLRQLVKEYDLFVIYITHHQDEAKLIADEVVYLSKDRSTNSVNKIAKGTITEFIEQTPTIESAKVFHFPDLNILHFRSTDAKVHLSKEQSGNCIAFKSDFLAFNNECGFEFEVIAKSAVYNQIKLQESANILIVKNKNISNFKYCTLEGQCVEYDSQGFFLRKLQVSQNKIISE